MSDSIAPIMAFAAGAWLLTLGLFPLAAVFILAALYVGRMSGLEW